MTDTNISTLGTDCVSAIGAGTLPLLTKVNLPDGTIPVAKLVAAQHVIHVAFNATNLSYVLPQRCIGAWIRPGAGGGAGGGGGGVPTVGNHQAGGGGSSGRAGGSCIMQYVPLAIAAGTTVAVTVGAGGTGGAGGNGGTAGGDGVDGGNGNNGTPSKIEVGGNVIVEAQANGPGAQNGHGGKGTTNDGAAGAAAAQANVNWPFTSRIAAVTPGSAGSGGTGGNVGGNGGGTVVPQPIFTGATTYIANVTAATGGTATGGGSGGGAGGGGGSSSPGDEFASALGIAIPP